MKSVFAHILRLGLPGLAQLVASLFTAVFIISFASAGAMNGFLGLALPAEIQSVAFLFVAGLLFIATAIWFFTAFYSNFISLLAALGIFAFAQPAGFYSTTNWQELASRPGTDGGVTLFSILYPLLTTFAITSLALNFWVFARLLRSSELTAIDQNAVAALKVSFNQFKRSAWTVRVLAAVVLTYWVLQTSISLVSFAVGVSIIDLSTPEPIVRLVLALLAIVLIFASKWNQWGVWALAAVTVLWPILIQQLLVSVIPTDLELQNEATLGLWQLVSIAQSVTFVALVASIAAIAVNRYRERVKSWIDNRIREIYGTGEVDAASNQPAQVSVLAVIALILAFVFPIAGLILAHAARNEIALSKGRKHGLSMSIAASVTAWTIIILAFFYLLLLTVLAPILFWDVPNIFEFLLATTV